MGSYLVSPVTRKPLGEKLLIVDGAAPVGVHTRCDTSAAEIQVSAPPSSDDGACFIVENIAGNDVTVTTLNVDLAVVTLATLTEGQIGCWVRDAGVWTQVPPVRAFDMPTGQEPDTDRACVTRTEDAAVGATVAVEEIVFAAGTFNTGVNAPSNQGVRTVDMSNYPAVRAGRTREVRFVATLRNALDSATYFSQVELVDLDHGEVTVDGTELDNDGASDLSVAIEFTSGPLTVGEGAGDLRSDAPTLYAVRLSGNGIADAETERAILEGARLQIRYVA